jgi:hypothetical protein
MLIGLHILETALMKDFFKLFAVGETPIKAAICSTDAFGLCFISW